MRAIASIIDLDLKGIMRDGVMLINIGMSLVVVAIIAVVGIYNHDNPEMVAWFPFLIVMSVMTGPGGFGFLFGLLMVDEKDTGVRNVLAVAPIQPSVMLATRTLLMIAYLLAWPLLTVAAMNVTWQALPITYTELLLVAASFALIGPVTALAVASYASNKVEALALFKFISFLTIAPLALKFIPGDAWYRSLFLLSPSGPGYMAFDAFVDHRTFRAVMFAMIGITYNLVLLAVCIRYYQSTLHKTD
ncbi:hypothetical protein [Hyphomonas sp.]|uniref:hypothetical protein n=1 Tax=Hyphomonas sp. TaxID=87 RepID=UPI003F6F2DDA